MRAPSGTGTRACPIGLPLPNSKKLIDPPAPHQTAPVDEGDFLAEIACRRALGLADGTDPASQPYLQALRRVWARNCRALASYAPRHPVALPARLWLARDQGSLAERHAAWEALLPGLVTDHLDTDHFGILQGAQATTLATGIARLMIQADRTAAE